MRLLKFLSYIIAIQLIIPTNIINTSYALTDEEKELKEKELKEKEEECKKEGRVFKNGQCRIDGETATLKNEAKKCTELPVSEQEACREKVALENSNNDLSEEGLNEKQNKYNPFDILLDGEMDFQVRGLALQVLNGAIIYYLLERKFSNQEICQSPSLYLIFGGALAAGISEVASNAYYHSELDDIYDEYNSQSKCTTDSTIEEELNKELKKRTDKDTVEQARAELNDSAIEAIEEEIRKEKRESNELCSDETEFDDRSKEDLDKLNRLQTKSFKLLEKQERAKATAARIKAGGYAAAALAFTAAAGVIIYEVAQPGNYCPDKKNKKPTPNNKQSTSYIQIHELIDEIKTGIAAIEFENKKNNLDIDFYLDPKDLTPEIIQEITMRNILKVAGNDALKHLKMFSNANATESLKEDFYKKQGNFWTEGLLAPLGVIFGQIGAGSALAAIPGVYSVLLESPIGRSLVAGGLATNSYFVFYYSLDAAELSDKRADAIKKIDVKFNKTGGAGFKTCLNRNNPREPACFCYLENGKKNPRRFSSQTCLNEWDEGGPLKPTDYRITFNKSKGPKVCITLDGKFDEKCACRSAKKEKDQCSSIQPKVNFDGIKSSFVSATVQEIDSISNGVLSPADIEVGKNLNNAIKFARRVQKLKKNNPFFKKNNKKIKSLISKLNNVNRSIASKAAQIATANQVATTPLSEIKSPKDALKALKKNLINESKKKNVTGAFTKPEKKDNELDDFDFGGDLEASPGVSVTDLDAAMNKEYDFKGDINNNPDNNLFDILSLRYQRSALRRLFDDEGKMQADEAANSDINER